MSEARPVGPVKPMRSPQIRINVSASEVVLAPEHLLAAISGHLDDGSALVGWARELGDLHAALLPGCRDPGLQPADFEEAALREQIVRVITDIDSWAVFHLPRPTGARRHTHSFGEVISHVAQNFAAAWWTIRHTNDEQLRHEAWFHLAQIREGYSDLVTDIHARCVELPLGWRGITPTP
ncbi:hypothetical protein [Nocardia xishanensis]|uniref:hypothetical protein n=1 Tax=Nocardia xishanensis TaxID=238964 RepID=UPI00082A5EB6|nr:hypothetical protein [Nocardia xishanensis]